MDLITAINTLFAKKYKDPKKYEEFVLSKDRKNLCKAVAQELAFVLPEGSQILDLAAGTGLTSNALLDRGFIPLATDHNQSMLNEIKNPAIKTAVCDYNNPFEFSDNSFDGVTILWGNRYIKDIPEFLSQVYRVLKPDGVFVWPYFDIETPVWMYLSQPKPLPTAQNLIKLAKEVGFRITFKPQRYPLSVVKPGYIICTKPISR
ncbi:methyltransferase domain-containing protein [Patescibacteria group bacterium]|nr:methyltransferase domain-containing protein [Patescibacteria group bacterium]